MEELVFKGDNNHALTNSLLVAEKFGKEHRHVLRDIRNLTAQNWAETDYQQIISMFVETTYLNERNQSQPMFIMNRDGFTLLAMGFTGAKAIGFKLKFISAFNNMEAILHSDTYGYALRLDNIEKKQIAMESEVQVLRTANVELHRKNLQLTFKAVFFDNMVHLSDTVHTTTAVAMELDMSARKLYKELEKLHVIYKQGKRWILAAPYVNCGYHKISTLIDSSGKERFCSTSYITWTEKGRIFLHSILNDKIVLHPLMLTQTT